MLSACQNLIYLSSLRTPFTGKGLFWSNSPQQYFLDWSVETHAQLCGDAAYVIASFQLTYTSYDYSIALLKEQFGQTYKQVDTHMQALIDSPNPKTAFPACVSSMTLLRDRFAAWLPSENQRTHMVVC